MTMRTTKTLLRSPESLAATAKDGGPALRKLVLSETQERASNIVGSQSPFLSNSDVLIVDAGSIGLSVLKQNRMKMT